MADVLLVVDMQVGLLNGDAKHDLDGVVTRINRLAARVRARRGGVYFIQHTGPVGDDFARHTPGWRMLPAIDVDARDRVFGKTLNDPFFHTPLRAAIAALTPERVFVTGWATDLCVDATVRSAAAAGFNAIAVADGHTVSDRPHLAAEGVIEHHHWIWRNLLAAHPVTVAPEVEL